jgi:hypothetical protein
MKSKERVLTAFAHKEPDRVPISELYINSPVASKILGREAYVGWGGRIRGQILNDMLIEGKAKNFYEKETRDLVDLYRKLELDTIMIERPPLKEPQIPEKIDDVTWKFEDKNTGFWSIWKYTKDTDNYGEIDSYLRKGKEEAFERYLEFLEQPIEMDTWDWSQAEYIVDRCSSDMFVMAVVEIDFPPTSFISWGEVFMESMILRPDLVERYLDYRVKKGLKFIDRYAEMGVDCIFCGEDWAGVNGLIFSPLHFKKFYFPRIKRLIDRAHDKDMLYMKHTDGNIMSIEKEFFLDLGLDAYQSVDPEAGMDIYEIKNKYGSKVTLMGNVDCAGTLHFGTPQQVEEETKRIIKNVSPGGGHILSSSNTIHSGIPADNFLTMLKTAREYGKYPIRI